MEKRVLGKTGMAVTVLGFGGAEIGFQGIAQETVTQLLNQALDAGLNIIDTAECYVDSEEKIGRAVSHRRQDFFLFTKCGHGGTGAAYADWDPRLLAQQIDHSLKRLRTDRLDLVQLHSCSQELLRKGEVSAVLQRARDMGKVRFIGYSGDGEAARYALECGAFDTLQTSLNIADQEAIDLLLPLAREKQVGVIAKRPVANAAWRSGTKPADNYQHAYWDRLQQLRYGFLNSGKKLEDTISVALRFTLGQPGVGTAIVGSTKPGRWGENAQLLSAGPLPPEQIQAIRGRWQEVAKADWAGQT